MSLVFQEFAKIETLTEVDMRERMITLEEIYEHLHAVISQVLF